MTGKKRLIKVLAFCGILLICIAYVNILLMKEKANPPAMLGRIV